MSEESPKLPEKYNLESLYVDEARVAKNINDAIDSAHNSNWEECLTHLDRAEGSIEGFEPYDTQDVYLPGMWKDTVNQVRSFVEYHSKG